MKISKSSNILSKNELWVVGIFTQQHPHWDQKIGIFQMPKSSSALISCWSDEISLVLYACHNF